jgi:ribose 5-phosphate isomerase B
MKSILIATDHAGFVLKERLKAFLEKKGLRVKDLGTFADERCDYPVFAARLAKLISAGSYPRGVLICKSGIGNSIVANRFPRVRAALCYNAKAAKLSRLHNDSNVLVLGSFFVNEKLAKKILNVWLKTEFLAGRHKKRLGMIEKIEKELIPKLKSTST